MTGRRREDVPTASAVIEQMPLNDLAPSDIIAAGRGAGAETGFDPPLFLKSADVMLMSITDFGVLPNTTR